MDTNKMRDISREQFEEEVKKHFVSVYGVRDWLSMMANGEYQFEKIRLAWVFWKASREAVVVELPSEDTCRTSTSKEEAAQDAYNHALGECRSVIEAQGLKVAP